MMNRTESLWKFSLPYPIHIGSLLLSTLIYSKWLEEDPVACTDNGWFWGLWKKGQLWTGSHCMTLSSSFRGRFPKLWVRTDMGSYSEQKACPWTQENWCTTICSVGGCNLNVHKIKMERKIITWHCMEVFSLEKLNRHKLFRMCWAQQIENNLQ